jgi:hypothetical protein
MSDEIGIFGEQIKTTVLNTGIRKKDFFSHPF